MIEGAVTLKWRPHFFYGVQKKTANATKHLRLVYDGRWLLVFPFQYYGNPVLHIL